MPTIETNGDGRAVNPSGVYRHPDTGEELVTQATEKFGNPQADAIVRLGFQYVGQLSPKSKLTQAPDPSAAPLADVSPNHKSVDELKAELAEAEERQKKNEAARSDSSSLVEKSAPKKAEEKKEAK